MNEGKYWNLMSRYVASGLSLKETEDLLEWLGDDPERADLLKELQETWDKTKHYPENFNVDAQSSWLKLRSNIRDDDPESPGSIGKMFKIVIVAGGIFLAVSVAIISFHYYNTSGKTITIETTEGEQKQIILKGGTRVWLNENSSITYTGNSTGGSVSRVSLRGEGYFEVAEPADRLLIVESGKTLTEVFSGAFDIRQQPGSSVKLSVVSGKVFFRPEEGSREKLVLLKGDEGIIHAGGYAVKAHSEDSNFLFWKNKSLSFRNAPFAKVVKTLSECYSVSFRIKDPEVLDMPVTASFNKAPLDHVISLLQTLLNLRIERSDSVCIISKY